ncbi:MAG: sugar MFS transporter [Myxococcales bacterium]|nr:sugar MFS transporter [Myxococcales bacterium]
MEEQHPAQGRPQHAAFALLTLLFFMWGFVTTLNDILIPHLKDQFELSATQAMLVQLCFFGAYFTMALPAGKVIATLGYRRGVVVGLAIAGLGALGFLPAASQGSYALFLLALFVLASGITVLQVSANPYVTSLGSAETGASRLNLAQGLNSLGTTLGPAFGAYLILDSGEVTAVRGPYLGIAATLFVLAAVFLAVRLPEPQPEAAATEPDEGKLSLRQHPRLWLGTLAIFFYVGAEVSIGSMLVLFFGLDEVAGLEEQAAGFYVPYYWGAAMVGRFVGAALQRRLAPTRVLAAATVLAMVLIGACVALRGPIAVPLLLAVGFANSIMFPTIFALAVTGMGRQTSRASSLLVMAIVGGALIPVAMGAIADSLGYAVAIAATIPCYAYIGWYALRFHARSS